MVAPIIKMFKSPSYRPSRKMSRMQQQDISAVTRRRYQVTQSLDRWGASQDITDSKTHRAFRLSSFGRSAPRYPLNYPKPVNWSFSNLGVIAPPIAGRPANYVVRQLYFFQDGSRSGPSAALMHGVVQKLSVDDMVAIAAYLASLEP
jgi:hypothetical protein